ncbi:OmpA family protein [Paracraurococcus lichenis]|uniref:OmpA family protein n=1 Tax=Paracraurococcus lichenis TaxID=3064888 RepID=A0ABT9DV43_9PROT|nr:OmpA family protein [Paracraurococcus sp. LOR1-02]MDO9707767.1 OmpA family protein [Paracraurococcus sp. LOR1-02]
MRRPALVLIAGALLLPPAARAEERATGAVTVEQPPPEARGATATLPDGRVVEVPRGAALQVDGANVVVEHETPRGTTLTLQNDVLFDFDKTELKPAAAEALGRVVDIIRQRHPRAVTVVGHTDAVGSDAYNDRLSLQRAEAVQRWLATEGGGGLPPLRVEGKGEREPVAPDTLDGKDNPAGRAQNRRVEVLLDR